MLVNLHPDVKLGRREPLIDPRVPMFAALLTPALPPIRPSVDWTKGLTSWGMMLNDQLGDCAEAMVGHVVQTWSANVRTEFTATDSEIQTLYEQATGYVPGQPSTDQGTVIVDLLNFWLTHPLCGHHLVGFANVNFKSTDEVKQAITLCGAVAVGVNLPIAAQSQSTWYANPNLLGDNTPASWGRHAVTAVAYDETYVTFITWGMLKRATWQWWTNYVEESYALAGAAWVAKDGLTPVGIDLATLETYMNVLRS